MLYDWGIHLIDQVLQILTGDIKSVYCRFDHITNQEVDDGFRLIFRLRTVRMPI